MHSDLVQQQGLRPLWTKTLVSLGAFAVLVGAAFPGQAQGVCSDPANHTQNCDFATGILLWVPEMGSDFSHALEGAADPGSIQIDSQWNAGESTDYAKINQCVGGLAGFTGVNFGAWFRVVAGSVEGCGTTVSRYTDDNCTSYYGGRGTYNAVSASRWTWIGGLDDLDPAVRGIRISTICFSILGAFTMRIDDIYLREGLSDPIFGDGFETGNTSAWSTIAP